MACNMLATISFFLVFKINKYDLRCLRISNIYAIAKIIYTYKGPGSPVHLQAILFHTNESGRKATRRDKS